MVTWLTPRGSLGIHQIEDELNPFHMEEQLYRHMKTQLSAELGDSTSYYFLKTSCLHWKWTDSRLKKSAVARCAWVFFHSLFINLFLNILRNWVVINIVSVQSLSHVQLFTTSWTAERQTSLSSPTPGACSNSCPFSWWRQAWFLSEWYEIASQFLSSNPTKETTLSALGALGSLVKC